MLQCHIAGLIFPKSWQTCEVCGVGHVFGREALLSSRDAGNECCGYIARAIDLLNIPIHSEMRAIPAERILFPNTLTIYSSGNELFSIYTSKGQNQNLSPELKFLYDPSGPASDETFRFIKSQLKDCLKNHPRCTASKQGLRPSRLVSIGYPSILNSLSSIPQKRKPSPKLKLVSGASARIEYTALSYCWGADSQGASHRTMKHNLARRLEVGIAFDELPVTLRDAIKVTLKLGRRYIWIDSLCIVQDDENDWRRESSNMGAIYENATLALIAGSSATSHDGFLNLAREKPVCLDPNATDGALMARKINTSGVHGSPGGTIEPTEKRAWTFQERVMARRAVFYSKQEVQWLCKTTVTCQCQVDMTGTASHWGVDLYRQQNPGLEYEYSWLWLVETYSDRHLTKETDRLPAVSGVARTLANFWKSESPSRDCHYLSGLWNFQILPDLCWYTHSELQYAPKSYIAPSFSWASIQGGIRFNTPNSDDATWYLKVIEAKTDLVSEDQYGQVCGGYIEVHGSLIPGKLSGTYDPVRQMRDLVIEFPGSSDKFDISLYADSYLSRVQLANGDSAARRTKDYSHHKDFIEAKAFLIPVFLGFRDFGDCLVALVLGRQEQAGCYERIAQVMVRLKRRIDDSQSVASIFTQREYLNDLATYWQSSSHKGTLGSNPFWEDIDGKIRIY